MNQLTMVLDELDERQPAESGERLPLADVQKLIDALRAEGGDMARIGSVIETLTRDNRGATATPRFACPNGSVRMPGNRMDVRTQTAGNGVMTGTGT